MKRVGRSSQAGDRARTRIREQGGLLAGQAFDADVNNVNFLAGRRCVWNVTVEQDRQSEARIKRLMNALADRSDCLKCDDDLLDTQLTIEGESANSVAEPESVPWRGWSVARSTAALSSRRHRRSGK